MEFTRTYTEAVNSLADTQSIYTYNIIMFDS